MRHWRVAAENKRRKPPPRPAARPSRGRPPKSFAEHNPQPRPAPHGRAGKHVGRSSKGFRFVFVFFFFQKLTTHVIRNRFAFGSNSVKRNSNRTRQPTERNNRKQRIRFRKSGGQRVARVCPDCPPGQISYNSDGEQTTGLSHGSVPVGAMAHSPLAPTGLIII